MNWRDGDRVRIVCPDFGAMALWPSSPFGTVRPFPPMARQLAKPGDEFDGCSMRERRSGGFAIVVWVEFDQPADDGIGDGPYRAASVDAAWLVRLPTESA